MANNPSNRTGKSIRHHWLMSYWPVALGLLLMYVPTYWAVAHTLWPEDDHMHGPLILLVSLGLAWLKRSALAECPQQPRPAAGIFCLLLGCVIYVIGRSQDIYLFDLGSQIPVFIGVLLLFRGYGAVRVLWFPLFFLLFLLPLPGPFVTMLTGPLQAWVSASAETMLYAVGYPVARSGVILQIGQYQLFVANACSGLNSMFSLTAMGLLYLYLMHHRSVIRNVILGLAILPLAFAANVVRVLILVLVTYHFGDATAQGFIHGFSGMILFVVALLSLFILDAFLGLVFNRSDPYA